MRRTMSPEIDRILARRIGITERFARRLRQELWRIIGAELTRPSEVYLAGLGGLVPIFRPRWKACMGWVKGHYFVSFRPSPEVKQRLICDPEMDELSTTRNRSENGNGTKRHR